MKKSYLKTVVPAVLLLPVALFVVLSIRSQLPDSHPLMKIYAQKITGLKTVSMSDAQKAQSGGREATFLRKEIFKNPTEYASFPLIQKARNFLGVIPNKIVEAVAQADFAISGAGIKTFYKAQYKPGTGKIVNLIAIPQLRMSKMGQIKKPKDWLNPNNFGYPGIYPYYFPLTLRKTPYGDIIYRV